MTKPFLHIIFLCSVLLISSCETNTDGCLNIFSNNYDVNASFECDSCCIFPDYAIELSMIYDTFPGSLNNRQFYPIDDMGNFIQIQRIQFALSDFKVYAIDSIIESIDTVIGLSTTLKDDFIVLEKDSSVTRTSRIIGKTDREFYIDSVSFQLGYNIDNISPIIESNLLRTGSNLYSMLLLDSMYVDSINTFYEGRVELLFPDSTFHKIEINEFQDQRYSFDINRRLPRGIDWDISIQLDAKNLVSGIDSTSTEAEINELIKLNLPLSIMLQ